MKLTGAAILVSALQRQAGGPGSLSLSFGGSYYFLRKGTRDEQRTRPARLLKARLQSLVCRLPGGPALRLSGRAIGIPREESTARDGRPRARLEHPLYLHGPGALYVEVAHGAFPACP